jgi:hypothetical protein
MTTGLAATSTSTSTTGAGTRAGMGTTTTARRRREGARGGREPRRDRAGPDALALWASTVALSRSLSEAAGA